MTSMLRGSINNPPLETHRRRSKAPTRKFAHSMPGKHSAGLTGEENEELRDSTTSTTSSETSHDSSSMNIQEAERPKLGQSLSGKKLSSPLILDGRTMSEEFALISLENEMDDDARPATNGTKLLQPSQKDTAAGGRRQQMGNGRQAIKNNAYHRAETIALPVNHHDTAHHANYKSRVLNQAPPVQMTKGLSEKVVVPEEDIFDPYADPEEDLLEDDEIQLQHCQEAFGDNAHASGASGRSTSGKSRHHNHQRDGVRKGNPRRSRTSKVDHNHARAQEEYEAASLYAAQPLRTSAKLESENEDAVPAIDFSSTENFCSSDEEDVIQTKKAHDSKHRHSHGRKMKRLHTS